MFRTVLLLTLALLVASVGHATTIHVPGDQPTIQAAIDAVAVGDTVLVAAGTYSGSGNRDLDFAGKDLVLRSEHGADVTVLDIGGSLSDRHRGISFRSAETVAAVVRSLSRKTPPKNGSKNSLINSDEKPRKTSSSRVVFSP